MGQHWLCAGIHAHIIMLHSAATAEEAQGLDAALTLPETRGLVDHLGFPKIWVAREMRSHRQSREGSVTQLVSSSVNWLMLSFSYCLLLQWIPFHWNFKLCFHDWWKSFWKRVSHMQTDLFNKLCGWHFFLSLQKLIKLFRQSRFSWRKKWWDLKME